MVTSIFIHALVLVYLSPDTGWLLHRIFEIRRKPFRRIITMIHDVQVKTCALINAIIS